MTLRPKSLVSWIALVAAACCPGTVLAGSITTLQFTNNTGGAVSRADFVILPPGTVQAPIIGTDPDTGLPRTANPVTIDPTRSSGFDTDNFSTALGTGTNVQGLRLLFGQKQTIKDGQVVFEPVFGPNGEPPSYLGDGGVVTFSLNLDPAFEGIIHLRSLTAGIDDPIIVVSGGDGGGGDGGGGSDPGDGGTPPNIPEPISLAIWSAAACCGWVGIRRKSLKAA